jgi:hypothetical protein
MGKNVVPQKVTAGGTLSSQGMAADKTTQQPVSKQIEERTSEVRRVDQNAFNHQLKDSDKLLICPIIDQPSRYLQ